MTPSLQNLKMVLISLSFVSLMMSPALAATHAKTKAKPKAPVVKTIALPEEEATEETMQSGLVAGATAAADTNIVADPTTAAPAALMPPYDAAALVPAAPASVKVDTAKLSEDQIPVLANTKEEKKSSGGQWQRVLATLGVLTLVFGALSFGLKRWMGKRNSSNQNTRIRVLTQHHVGPKKSLMIVQVAGESILIGVTDQNITMIKSLALIDDEIPEEIPNNFNHTLTGLDEFEEEQLAAPQPAVRSGRATKAIASRDAESEDFAMRGISEIRDVVSSRLKNMKSF